MGLDTALQRCSVAILDGDRALASETAEMERGHAEHLAPMAVRALTIAGVSVADLKRVGVVIGPGGFTGVRVALSFARGLAIGMALPVIGVTSLEVLAAEAAEKAQTPLIASVVDARRGQVYAALYEHGPAPVVAPFVADPAEASKRLRNAAGRSEISAIGSGASLLADANFACILPSAGIDAKIVARIASAATDPGKPPAPLYLRAPDAKPPKPLLWK